MLEQALHDATLHGFFIGERGAELLVTPLGRAVPKRDSRVLVTLVGLRALCICHESSNLDVRPSVFEVARPLSLENIAGAPEMYRHAFFYSSGRNDLQNHLAAERVDWLIGCTAVGGSPLAMHCSYQPGVDSTMLIWFRKIECRGLVPLKLTALIDRQRSWWREWERAWRSPGRVPRAYALSLPSGDEVDDVKYWQPAPAAPISTLGSKIALLAPIIEWAKKEHRLDRRTRGTEGSTPYLRDVVAYWKESDRACISLRGISYGRELGPDSPEQALDMLFRFRLLRRGGRWRITRSSSQRTTAADPKLARKKPQWIRSWTFGDVE